MPAASTEIYFAAEGQPKLRGGEHHGRLENILIYGIAALLLFAVLAFGAVEDWSTFALQAGAALLMLLWAVREALVPRTHMVGSPLFVPVALFLLIAAAQAALGLSVYGYATKQELLRLVAYGALLFVAVQVLETASARWRLAWVLGTAGFVIAIFAILQNLMSNGKIYWVRSPQFGGWIFGPYVNHNHYAGLMEMLFPIALALGLRRRQHRSRSLLLLFMSAVIAVSVLMSQSRAGASALVIETALAGILLYRRSRWRGAVVMLLPVVTAAALLWLNTTGVFTRMRETQDDVRSHVLRDSLQMVRERPVLGWGLGTFSAAYPQFRTYPTSVIVNYAHNDLLQVLIETGIAGFGLMLWLLGAVFRRGLAHAVLWDREAGGLVRVAALAGITGMVIHSLFDFNLHIPANAAMFSVICAMATCGGKAAARPQSP